MEFKQKLVMPVPKIELNEFSNIPETGKGRIQLKRKNNESIVSTALKLARNDHPLFEHFDKGVFIGEGDQDPRFAEVALCLDILKGIRIEDIFFPIIEPIDIITRDKNGIPTKVKYILNPGRIDLIIEPEEIQAVEIIKRMAQIGKICNCPTFSDPRIGNSEFFQEEIISELHSLTLTFELEQIKHIDEEGYSICNPVELNKYLEGEYNDSLRYIITSIDKILWAGRKIIVEIMSQEELLHILQRIGKLKDDLNRR